MVKHLFDRERPRCYRMELHGQYNTCMPPDVPPKTPNAPKADVFRYTAESFLGSKGLVDPVLCGIPLAQQVTKYVSTAAGQAVKSAYVARDFTKMMAPRPDLDKVDHFLSKCVGQAYQSVGSLLGVTGWFRFPQPQHTEELLWRIQRNRVRDEKFRELILNLPAMNSPTIAVIKDFMAIWEMSRGPDSDDRLQLQRGFDNIWGLVLHKMPLMNVDKVRLHDDIYGARGGRSEVLEDVDAVRVNVRGMTMTSVRQALAAVTVPDGIDCEGRLTTRIARTDKYIANKERLR